MKLTNSSHRCQESNTPVQVPIGHCAYVTGQRKQLVEAKRPGGNEPCHTWRANLFIRGRRIRTESCSLQSHLGIYLVKHSWIRYKTRIVCEVNGTVLQAMLEGVKS